MWCGKNISKNLLNKNILYIYIKNKEIKHIETLFTASNFKHLTGLKYKKGSKDFLKIWERHYIRWEKTCFYIFKTKCFDKCYVYR